MPVKPTIGLARGHREQPWRVAADEDGRPWTLHGVRMDHVARHTIVPTGEAHRFALEQPLDEDDGLRQSLDASGAWIETETGLLVLGLHMPGAEA
jgi:hypothetical protein